jgi:UDP-glucose 4-epimerase
MVEVDITKPELGSVIARAAPQVVFHLAAVSSVSLGETDPGRCWEVNVEGTARVLESAIGSGAAKMVNVSSLAVHGAHPEAEGSSYGNSKRVAEQRLSEKATGVGMGWTTLRPANIYGPRQYGDGESAVVATWMTAMAQGGPLFMDGDGLQTRDFLFIGDAIEAIVAAADRADRSVLEVGAGVETSLLVLLQTMKGITGWEGRLGRRPARTGDIRRSVVDPGPAEEALGWRAGTDLELGLRQTWDWARSL